MTATLTVAIPAKNSAHLLQDCLESVAFADEIIVVDMFSTDETERVCASFPQCRLIQRDGYIFENLNVAFDEAASDWVLRLDTDERLTPELAAEVEGILRNPPPDDVVGFMFWERPVMLGRELRHGFARRHYRKLLFRRGAARYPVRREHEDLDSTGRWERGRHGYIHLNYTTVAQYLQKTDYYTDRDVERAVLTAKPPARDGVIEPIRAFYLYYLENQGFRDGWVGFVDAAMRGFYQLVEWAKLRERWERERGGGQHAR